MALLSLTLWRVRALPRLKPRSRRYLCLRHFGSRKPLFCPVVRATGAPSLKRAGRPVPAMTLFDVPHKPCLPRFRAAWGMNSISSPGIDPRLLGCVATPLQVSRTSSPPLQ